MRKTIPTKNNNTYQLILPLNLAYLIQEDDELLSFCELIRGVDLEKYTTIGSRLGRRPINRIAIMEIILFGFMNDIRSTRKLEKACKTDIRFMYLLNGEKAPSHTTIQGVINSLSVNIEDIFMDIIKRINELEEIKIDFNEIFVDGTKIEADANKYSFVWRGTINYNLVNLVKKINKTLKNINLDELKELELPKMQGLSAAEEIIYKNRKRKEQGLEKLGRKAKVKIEDKHLQFMTEIENKLLHKIEFLGIKFVSGKGKRKCDLQKVYEEIVSYKEKLVEYKIKLETMGDGRNSYSKTDTDATFMRMKEDHMMNGQLKVGYSVQAAVSSEYIVAVDLYDSRSDQKTYIPFMNKYRELHGFYPKFPVADAGYGSYDNYFFNIKHEIELYQKYTMFSKEKERKYSQNPFRADNFIKNTDDTYTCPNNKKLYFKREYRSKSFIYSNKIKEYECESCDGCELKAQCSKSKGNRTIRINGPLKYMHKNR